MKPFTRPIDKAKLGIRTITCISNTLLTGRVTSQFEGPFCLSCTFIFRNERNWMKKSARVSEKLVSPGLAGLQVATRLLKCFQQFNDTIILVQAVCRLPFPSSCLHRNLKNEIL